MEKSEILIEHIEDAIPSILLAKFNTFKILDLESVSKIDPNEFATRKGIGKTVVKKLIEFQKSIVGNLDVYIDLQSKNTRTYNLPINQDLLDTTNFLDIFSEIITDYLNLLQKREHRGIINHLYGLNNSDKFTMDDLSHYYELTSERIRQIKILLLQDMRELLSGNYNSELKCRINDRFRESFYEIRNYFNQKKVFTFQYLTDKLREKFQCESAKEQNEIIDLLIDVFDFIKCGKVESNFTNANFIFTTIEEKRGFLKTSDKVLRFLKKKIIPLNEMQAVIAIKKNNKNVKNKHIIDALNILPEIEIIEANNQTYFQAKFEYLSNASDRAYRVLLENGNSMYIDDIVSEVNHRLTNTGTSKIYDRHSLAIASDNRFSSMAKTGFWNLTEWNKNTDKIELLIKNALYQLNKPASHEQIFKIINKDNPHIKEQSVRAITGRDCLKVEGNRWILPEWKQKYSDLAFLKRKTRVNTSEPEHRTEQRALVIKYLEKQASKKQFASNIIKEIGPRDKRFTNVSFYKLFEQNEYFIKDNSSSKLIITLQNQESNIKFSIDPFDWKNVRMKLERDLSAAFDDQTSPSYSQNLLESIQLFYELIMAEIPEPEFNGLPERILGNMRKYYFESSDSTDKLNFLKQFLTCTDPVLKKLLWFINRTNYEWIKTNKKGLGDIIDKLNKLDPTKERFKDKRTARAYRFGKQTQSVYFYRNNDTHGANDWTAAELVTTLTNCFTFYVFACAEYYEELTGKINNYNNS